MSPTPAKASSGSANEITAATISSTPKPISTHLTAPDANRAPRRSTPIVVIDARSN